MFDIKNIAHPECITTVYQVRTDAFDRIVFFVYFQDEWKWLMAEKWVPMKVGD